MTLFTTMSLLNLVLVAAPVPIPQPPPVAVLEDTDRNLGSGQPDFLPRQVAALKSAAVLREVLRQPNVRALGVVSRQPDAVAWMSKHLRVDLDAKARTLRVTFGDGLRREQVEIIDAVVEVYLHDLREELCRPIKARLTKTETDIQRVREELVRQKLLCANRQPLPDPVADKKIQEIELRNLRAIEQNLRTDELYAQRSVQYLHNKIRSPLRIVLVEKAGVSP